MAAQLRNADSIRSGLPFNITTGQDNAEGVANVRPAGIKRNAGEGPGQVSVDVHLGRKVTIHPRRPQTRYRCRVDSFNVLNHTNFNNYIGVADVAVFRAKPIRP